MIVVQPVEFFQFGPDILNGIIPAATSVSPNTGLQGTAVNVTVTGTDFSFSSVFSFGAGIVVSSVVIVNINTATMTLTISLTAAPGFYTLTTSNVNGSNTLSNAFDVLTAASTSIIPNHASQGQIMTATVLGSNFGPATVFDLGSGITISSVVIVNTGKATMVVTLIFTAPLGFHNLTTSSTGSSQVLSNAFNVLSPLFQFPTSGLDPADMAILGNTATQTLYWDYGNTQDFYIQVVAGQFGLTRATLFAVSPKFANDWFGNQAPAVTYDPFSFNPSKPSNL